MARPGIDALDPDVEPDSSDCRVNPQANGGGERREGAGVASLHANVDSGDCNGYTHSAGVPAARKAIAARYSLPTSPVTMNDVIITSGCSGALDLAISAMVNEGDNVLLPMPGFALYNTIVQSRGGKCKDYRLIPEVGCVCVGGDGEGV